MSGSFQRLILSTQDYERLVKFLRFEGFKSVPLLAERLANARVVPPTEIPSDVVTMNSVAEFRDIESGSAHEVTLSYPFGTERSESVVSILSPIGVEVLGMRVGHRLIWPTPTGPSKVCELSRIVFQPEAAGLWDL